MKINEQEAIQKYLDYKLEHKDVELGLTVDRANNLKFTAKELRVIAESNPEHESAIVIKRATQNVNDGRVMYIDRAFVECIRKNCEPVMNYEFGLDNRGIPCYFRSWSVGDPLPAPERKSGKGATNDK